MPDIVAEKKTVSEERIEAAGSVNLPEGTSQIVIALPEPVPAGKKLVGTVSLRAVYTEE